MTIVRVNLLPSAYELRYQRTRRLRRWVTVGIVLVAMQIPAFILIRQMGSQARELQRGLWAADQQRQVIHARIQALTAHQDEVDRQQQLADQLTRKHHWSGLFAAVSGCLPETVVLTRLETDPPKSGANAPAILPVRGLAGGEGGSESSGVARGLIISGVAIDHDSVAAFLRNLNAGGQLGRCSLESTLRQPFLDAEAVSFTVRTQW